MRSPTLPGKGLYSRHNYRYWTGSEYLSFGPSASSDFAGKRFTLVEDLQAYIDGIRTGGDIMAEIEEIAPRERANEYIMTRMRTTAGVDPEEYERKYMLPFAPLEKVLQECARYGNAQRSSDGKWSLTPKGMLISNSILASLGLAQEEAANSAAAAEFRVDG